MMDKKDIFVPISSLLKTFIKYPYYFLTEEDVRSFLVHHLYKRHNLKTLKETSDNKLTIAIHSEVRWYKYSNDQNKRTDIVLIDPEDLEMTNLNQTLPTKCFGFNNYWAAVELKMRRHNNFQSDARLLREVKKDMDSLKLVRAKSLELNPYFQNNPPVYCVICLDRGTNIKIEIDTLRNEYADSKIGLIYLNEQ